MPSFLPLQRSAASGKLRKTKDSRWKRATLLALAGLALGGAAACNSARGGGETSPDLTRPAPVAADERDSRRVRHPALSLQAEADSMTGAPALRPAPEPAPGPGGEGQPPFNTEEYDRIYENPFLDAAQRPLSTFSADVDTASYSNVRRFLNTGRQPPPDAVRIEELVNYFDYDYAGPENEEQPFAVHGELAACPWNPERKLLRIGIQAQQLEAEETPPRNLVFLLDVSGSMNAPNKLPLLKRGMQLLTEQLTENDRVAVVVYAGASGVVLPPTSGADSATILAALERLKAGGSTNGAAGIELAYRTAREHFKEDGINRVILATDGDFNVGVSDRGQLVRMIEKERESGVFLTVLGFGGGNYKDATMEQLANKGNGNYAYIDNVSEARKVLVQQAGSTLVTVAKDVKLQIEFNPQRVQSYRLIGYENRVLRDEDFNDDTKDAGEIGAGHNVTALYEIVPTGQDSPAGEVDPLRYQADRRPSDAARSEELATVKIRYKEPQGKESRLLSFPVLDRAAGLAEMSGDFRFAAAVAAYGMLLRDSEHKGEANFSLVRDLARGGLGEDPHGYRAEFLRLVAMARDMQATVSD